jgi:hypothetical protein
MLFDFVPQFTQAVDQLGETAPNANNSNIFKHSKPGWGNCCC